MFSRKNLVKAFSHYLSNISFIWLGILIYKNNQYYVDFLRNDTQAVLFYLALAYTILGFPYHIVNSFRGKESKGYSVLRAIIRVILNFFNYLNDFIHDRPVPKLSRTEKKDMLFMLVKLFYLPIMLNFTLNNYHSTIYQFKLLKANLVFSPYNFVEFYYPFIIPLMFLIDTSIFAFGYAVESGFLKNKVKSVEPTLFGWMVALICYPPFNNIVSWYVPWYSNDYSWFGSYNTTMFARMVLLVLLFIYVWATLALGFKSSNLTNRGIVTKGPYRFVRHPAYISKNLIWWITAFPVMSIGAFISLSIWTTIYFLRAITEERHLLKDNDYKEYIKKVKYRYVPFVF